MTLTELIQKLQELKEQHGGDTEVEITIPAFQGSYEEDYNATDLTDSNIEDLTWKGVKTKYLFLTFE